MTKAKLKKLLEENKEEYPLLSVNEAQKELNVQSKQFSKEIELLVGTFNINNNHANRRRL